MLTENGRLPRASAAMGPSSLVDLVFEDPGFGFGDVTNSLVLFSTMGTEHVAVEKIPIFTCHLS